MTASTGLAFPPVFYKFYPIEAWLPKLLAGESLLFSSRTTFNDPFDCRPGFKLGGGLGVEKYLHAHFRKTNLSPSKRLKAVAEIINKNRDGGSLAASETEKMLDDVGVLCLAPDWKNPLMWAHYAAHHRGICVGFRSNIGIFQAANPVEYADVYPMITRPQDSMEEMFRKTFLTKDRAWRYEKEWRIMKNFRTPEGREREFTKLVPYMSVSDALTLADQRGATIYTFDKSAIESVTLGMRVSLTDEHTVAASLKAEGLSIPLYKVQPPATNYILSRARIV